MARAKTDQQEVYLTVKGSINPIRMCDLIRDPQDRLRIVVQTSTPGMKPHDSTRFLLGLLLPPNVELSPWLGILRVIHMDMVSLQSLDDR